MKKINFLLLIVLSAILFITTAFETSYGLRKIRPQHHEYANVVINKFSEKNKIAPVVFNHWLHRAKYTCRLCHEDLNFSMEPNGTGITESANKKGLYCGACHNGKEAFAPVEKGQSGSAKKNCDRCHSYGKKVKFEKTFYIFTKDFPRSKFGNGVNWIRSEKEGFLGLKDRLDGGQKKGEIHKESSDAFFDPKVREMPQIIFSHKKHAVWNGCKLCHPGIFADKKGVTKFTMEDIFAGKFCGTCHGKVSFPTLDCRRCHVKDIIVKEVK